MQKSVMIGALGAVIIGVAVGLSVWVSDGQPPPPAAQNSKTQDAAAPEAPPQKIIPPSFDVVRVNPEGNAVMAGRAHPQSTVEILDGDAVFGSVTTDSRGEWVFVPKNLLEPGERRLGLRMLMEGRDPVLSEYVVILVVPERSAGGRGALALKVRRDGTGPSEVLQKPGPTDIFGVDSVDYGNGQINISGHAKPNKRVQLYIDNRFIGRTVSDADKGLWSLTPETDIAPGTYTLRADMVDQDGQVLARREFPFQRADLKDMEELKPGAFVVVQPGNSLWRLALRSYGQGVRFHTIFEANRDLISDPNLIYPGQVFRLPGNQ